MRHLLSLKDISSDELSGILDNARNLKAFVKKGTPHRYLEGMTLGMLFQKPSNRTRVSFEVGMYQLGGHALNLLPSEIQMKTREPIADIAKVMSRYVNIMMLRVMSHQDLVEFAEAAAVPIINGLSDKFHPCQAAADALTITERKGSLEGLKLAFIGDGNNVCASLINLGMHAKFHVTVCCPDGFEPKLDGEFEISHDPKQAIKDADVVYTDVWTSMGQEDEAESRKEAFANFTITSDLLSHAANDVLFMHCLPAHRGEEVEDDVISSRQSVVFDQAENRLHAQKAILCFLLDRQLQRELF